jgi:hypothetical protein
MFTLSGYIIHGQVKKGAAFDGAGRDGKFNV